MSKQKKLKETHGKIEDGQPTMLEQVWGFNELARYNTLDEATYQQTLKDMTRTDLEAHARKLGVVVIESSARLQDKLFQEFRTYKAALKRPTSKPVVNNPSPEVKKILAEGR